MFCVASLRPASAQRFAVDFTDNRQIKNSQNQPFAKSHPRHHSWPGTQIRTGQINQNWRRLVLDANRIGAKINLLIFPALIVEL